MFDWLLPETVIGIGIFAQRMSGIGVNGVARLLNGVIHLLLYGGFRLVIPQPCMHNVFYLM